MRRMRLAKGAAAGQALAEVGRTPGLVALRRTCKEVTDPADSRSAAARTGDQIAREPTRHGFRAQGEPWLVSLLRLS
jgi:hypothetical protein